MSWAVSPKVVDRTIRRLSDRDAEAFALWTAPIAGGRGDGGCEVARLVTPRQEAHGGARGAYVHAPGEELRRIAFDNYKRGERNVAQIHTHPSDDTRMSELDKKWEVVAHPGALSIIVPGYCRGGMSSFRMASVYERESGGRWRLWGAGELEARVSIV